MRVVQPRGGGRVTVWSGTDARPSTCSSSQTAGLNSSGVSCWDSAGPAGAVKTKHDAAPAVTHVARSIVPLHRLLAKNVALRRSGTRVGSQRGERATSPTGKAPERGRDGPFGGKGIFRCGAKIKIFGLDWVVSSTSAIRLKMLPKRSEYQLQQQPERRALLSLRSPLWVPVCETGATPLLAGYTKPPRGTGRAHVWRHPVEKGLRWNPKFP
jgi:hypothetical protein